LTNAPQKAFRWRFRYLDGYRYGMLLGLPVEVRTSAEGIRLELAP